MLEDPIVSETRKVRDEYAAQFDYDLGRIILDLQSRQGKDGRRVVDRTSPKMPGPNDASVPPATPILHVLSSATG